MYLLGTSNFIVEFEKSTSQFLMLQVDIGCWFNTKNLFSRECYSKKQLCFYTALHLGKTGKKFFPNAAVKTKFPSILGLIFYVKSLQVLAMNDLVA